MIKKIIATSSIISMMLAVSPVFAMPHMVSSELNTPGTNRTLLLPPAADHSPVISLGTALDPASGKTVEGIAFVHYKKDFGKSNGKDNGKGKPAGGGSSCYAFLANGAEWNSTEDYLFDATNSENLDETILRSLLSESVEIWDGEVTADVFGIEAAGIVDGVDQSSPDGKNEVLFGDVSSQGAIAVTIVWGIFSGPPSQRALVEWDMIFDEADFDWSTEVIGVDGRMDFQNIAVHEVGHAAGMGHPEGSCLDETMYAYANFAEIKKRDLNAGDITGIKKLYR
ncbi:MAG: matrixin family metalloprotease [Parcubacteria group bacterium]